MTCSFSGGSEKRCAARLTWRSTVWLLLLATMVNGAAAESGRTDSVDTSPRLIIGEHVVSAYRVEKNFRRHLASRTSSASVREWFSQFLVQQVLMAEALRLGFGERQEVLFELERMERHMLTQDQGPFYEKLYRESGGLKESIEESYAQAERAYEVEIVSVPTGAPAAELLPKNGAPDDSLVARLQASGQTLAFSGWTAWPFDPFESVASAFASAPLKTWQTVRIAGDITVFRVNAIAANPRPSLDEWTGFLEASNRRLGQRAVRKSRQETLLSDAGFRFDWAAADLLLRRLMARRPDSAHRLNEADIPEGLPALAHLSAGSSRHAITATDYVRHHNALFIRRVPASAWDIYQDVRSMVVAEADLRDARKCGVDRAPKFLEDRANYRDALALELFQRERLAPTLGVNEADVARFYETHPTRFARARWVEGTLVRFERLEHARAFARAAAESAGRAPIGVGGVAEKLRVERDAPPPLPFPAELVLDGQAPPVLGPVATGSAFAVWLSSSARGLETRPLAEVANEIRTELERPPLEEAQRKLAQEIARRMRVDDRIDYAAYELDEPPVAPWQR